MSFPLRALRPLILGAALSLAAAGPTAHAALLSFDAELVQPGLSNPVILSENVVMDPLLREIQTGDELPYLFLLKNDYVDAFPASIVLGLEAGGFDEDGDNVTGWGPGAYWEFRNFVLDPGEAIEGITITAFNVQNFGSPQLINGAIRILIDELDMPAAVCDGGSANCGTLTLNLQIEDVPAIPEPSTYALLAAGLLVIGGAAIRGRKPV